jgi:hypothetical protein
MKRSIATIQAILVAGAMADAVFSPNITVSSVTVGTTLPVGYTPGNGHDIDLFLGNSTDNFPIVGRSEAWLGKPVQDYDRLTFFNRSPSCNCQPISVERLSSCWLGSGQLRVGPLAVKHTPDTSVFTSVTSHRPSRRCAMWRVEHTNKLSPIPQHEHAHYIDHIDARHERHHGPSSHHRRPNGHRDSLGRRLHLPPHKRNPKLALLNCDQRCWYSIPMV